MAVTNYTTLALALSANADVDGGGLDANTEPTLTEANHLHDRASLMVRLAFLRTGLADTPTSGSFADELAIYGETLWTSYLVLVAKSALLEDQERTARLLLASARQVTGYTDPKLGWVPGDVESMRQVLLGQGASVSLPAVDAQVANSSTDMLDPNVIRTTGDGGDYEYVPEPTFAQGDTPL